jgi:hypothetical protein
MSPEDFVPKLAEASWEMKEILITRDKQVDLIKGKKAGLKHLLITTCFRRRIGERTIRDGGRRRAPKPFVFLERCTYKGSTRPTSGNEYYWQKG